MWYILSEEVSAMGFQENLIRLREAVSPSAKSFAKQIGLSYTTYFNYEKGAWPNEDNLKIIAEALNVSTDELLGFSSPEEHNKNIQKVKAFGLSIREHEGFVDVDIEPASMSQFKEAESAIVSRLKQKKGLPIRNIPCQEFDQVVQSAEKRAIITSRVQIIEDILFRLYPHLIDGK